MDDEMAGPSGFHLDDSQIVHGEISTFHDGKDDHRHLYDMAFELTRDTVAGVKFRSRSHMLQVVQGTVQVAEFIAHRQATEEPGGQAAEILAHFVCPMNATNSPGDRGKFWNEECSGARRNFLESKFGSNAEPWTQEQGQKMTKRAQATLFLNAGDNILQALAKIHTIAECVKFAVNNNPVFLAVASDDPGQRRSLDEGHDGSMNTLSHQIADATTSIMQSIALQALLHRIDVQTAYNEYNLSPSDDAGRHATQMALFKELLTLLQTFIDTDSLKKSLASAASMLVREVLNRSNAGEGGARASIVEATTNAAIQTGLVHNNASGGVNDVNPANIFGAGSESNLCNTLINPDTDAFHQPPDIRDLWGIRQVDQCLNAQKAVMDALGAKKIRRTANNVFLKPLVIRSCVDNQIYTIPAYRKLGQGDMKWIISNMFGRKAHSEYLWLVLQQSNFSSHIAHQLTNDQTSCAPICVRRKYLHCFPNGVYNWYDLTYAPYSDEVKVAKVCNGAMAMKYHSQAMIDITLAEKANMSLASIHDNLSKLDGYFPHQLTPNMSMMDRDTDDENERQRKRARRSANTKCPNGMLQHPLIAAICFAHDKSNTYVDYTTDANIYDRCEMDAMISPMPDDDDDVNQGNDGNRQRHKRRRGKRYSTIPTFNERNATREKRKLIDDTIQIMKDLLDMLCFECPLTIDIVLLYQMTGKIDAVYADLTDEQRRMYHELFALFGRSFFDVGQMDTFQVMLHMYGTTATGKTPVILALASMFEPEDIAACSSVFEEKFGLGPIVQNDAAVVHFADARNTNMTVANFLNITSGDIANYPLKNVNGGVTGPFPAHVFSVSNSQHFLSGAAAQDEAVQRREVVFKMKYQVPADKRQSQYSSPSRYAMDSLWFQIRCAVSLHLFRLNSLVAGSGDFLTNASPLWKEHRALSNLEGSNFYTFLLEMEHLGLYVRDPFGRMPSEKLVADFTSFLQGSSPTSSGGFIEPKGRRSKPPQGSTHAHVGGGVTEVSFNGCQHDGMTWNQVVKMLFPLLNFEMIKATPLHAPYAIQFVQGLRESQDRDEEARANRERQKHAKANEDKKNQQVEQQQDELSAIPPDCQHVPDFDYEDSGEAGPSSPRGPTPPPFVAPQAQTIPVQHDDSDDDDDVMYSTSAVDNMTVHPSLDQATTFPKSNDEEQPKEQSSRIPFIDDEAEEASGISDGSSDESSDRSDNFESEDNGVDGRDENGDDSSDEASDSSDDDSSDSHGQTTP